MHHVETISGELTPALPHIRICDSHRPIRRDFYVKVLETQLYKSAHKCSSDVKN